MSDPADVVEEIWEEVHVILQHLADQSTASEIVRSVFGEQPGLGTEVDAKTRVHLILAARDACIAHLLLRVRHVDNGDSGAACLVLRHFDPHITAAVGRRISNPHDAEEVVNEVRMKLWRRLVAFEGGRRQLHSYVQTIVNSACTDRYRERPRCPDGHGEHGNVQFEPIGEQHELNGPLQDDGRAHRILEFRLFLKDNLPLLPASQREAVCAFLAFNTWSDAERQLGVPRQTLQSRFEVASRRLSKRYEDR